MVYFVKDAFIKLSFNLGTDNIKEIKYIYFLGGGARGRSGEWMEGGGSYPYSLVNLPM